MDYLAACQLMNTTCNTSNTLSGERTEALLAIDLELSTFAVEESKLRQARDTLLDTRNRSKMTAPVYRLPSEILARIFSDAACHCPPYPMVHVLVPRILNPLSICGVCREWRHVALGHSPLWTHIDLVVTREDSGHQYPSPEMWTKFSYGASLYVNIRQYRSLHQSGEEDGKAPISPSDFEDSPAPMVVKLGDFLLPLMPQICAVTLVLCSSMTYLPDKLLDWWSSHGTIGQAKAFSVQPDRNLLPLEIEALGFGSTSTGRNREFFRSLKELGLHNTIPQEWTNWSFGNLVSLYLEAGNDYLSMAQIELASVLTSCSRLQRLSIDNIIIHSTGPAPNPITLKELQLLDIDTYDVEQMIESVLAIIIPGPSALCMNISIPSTSTFPHPVLDTVLSFINRHNVTTLRIDNYGDEPCFASQLGPLPRVKTLVLHRCYFSDIAQVGHYGERNGSVTYTNPSPVNSWPAIWPNIQNLYIRTCVLQEDHLRRLLLPHSIQSLYIGRCYQGHTLHAGPRMQSPESKQLARSLSDIIPKAVHLEGGWNKWPRVSCLESW
ncbi:hypothetical protein FRC08_008814 [Ceratobasidium sp. 394]|nr:hypothetical protein FRC08_008814 [Ceratobasidium sp. 394]